MKRGFTRLWVFTSALWFTGCVLLLAWRIFGEPACYFVYTVSFVDPVPENDRAHVQEIKEKLIGQPLCGDTTPPLLLTLERLAKEGAATQISFQWQEPEGWSGETRSWIGILDGKEIKIPAIQEQVRNNVRKERLPANMWLVYIGVAVPLVLLVIGSGVFWVISGFQRK